jgi:hypothetical protein
MPTQIKSQRNLKEKRRPFKARLIKKRNPVATKNKKRYHAK